MEYRAAEAREKIVQDYGDTAELCKRLNTSPTDGWFDHVWLIVTLVAKNGCTQPSTAHVSSSEPITQNSSHAYCFDQMS